MKVIQEMRGGMIYLASPYSHPIPTVMEWRYNAVTAAVAEMLNHLLQVFSPITYTHPISKMVPGFMNDLDFWLDIDRGFMDVCDMMAILTLPGWRESKGIDSERDIMVGMQGKPLYFIDPYHLGIYSMIGMPPDMWCGKETDLWQRT